MAIEFYDSLNVESTDNSTFAGDITISKSTPKLIFDNLAGGGLDPSLTASGTNFTLSTSSITPLSIALDTGDATFAGDVLVEDNLYLTDTGTVRGKIQLNASDRDDLDIKVVSLGSNIKFFTVDTERMRIDSSGNVGIGTTNPSAKLEVNGSFRAGGGGGASSEFEVEGGGDIIARAPLKCEDDIELNAGLVDEQGSPGSNNYILKSTGSAVRWITFPGVTSTTTGEPSGSSTITNIVQIDLSDYNTAAGNGNLVTGTVYLIK